MGYTSRSMEDCGVEDVLNCGVWDQLVSEVKNICMLPKDLLYFDEYCGCRLS